MLFEDKQSLRQALKLRYFIRFWANGFHRIKTENVFHVLILLYAFAFIIVQITVSKGNYGAFGSIVQLLYSFSGLIITLLLITVGIWYIGLPNEFISITQNMKRIGLTNSVGEIPILIKRQHNSDNPAVEKWVFESYGIPFTSWKDCSERIESAFDVAFLSAEEGDNGRCVILSLVIHPGPWPKKLYWDLKYLSPNPSLIALGDNRSSQITYDLSVIPHILIAGRTGSGKSILVKIIALQALWKSMSVIIIDYKRGADYGKPFRLLSEMVFDDNTLISVLKEAHEEMLSRLSFLEDSDYTNVDVYNKEKGATLFPHRLIVFDEIAECLDTTGVSKERKKMIETIEKYISSIARLGRAAGINLVLATQRGSADVLTGQIRSNTYKICGISDDNLSILTLGVADAARKIPPTAAGRFLTEDGIMFQGYYSDFNTEVFPDA